MAGRTFRFGLMAGACCAALNLLVPNASAQAGAEPGTPFELAFWQAVAASNDPVLYQAYLRQYPSGTFAVIARARADTSHKPPAFAPPAPSMTPPIIPIPQFGTGLARSAPDAASAIRDATAAAQTAEAAQAAAAAATPAPLLADRPVVTAMATPLSAPPAPIEPPVFIAGPAPASVPAQIQPQIQSTGPMIADAVQDLFGNAAAMPVGGAALLAMLTTDAPHPPQPAAPPLMRPAMPEVPVALAMATPPPVPTLSAAKAPTAAPALTAMLGLTAAPVFPGAEALASAVAAQATPTRLAHAEPMAAMPTVMAAAAAPVVQRPSYAQAASQPDYAAYTASPRSSGRRAAMPAQFTRAVVSTAAVSVEMPDATSQISPLGIMLGQLVRTQETPGAQFGLQEAAAMPLRPRLVAVPEVAVPESFCSIEQRSAFSEGIYQPALAIAVHNDQAASAYVRRLRAIYDNYQLTGDSAALSAVAAEARDFWRQATAASSIHDELVNQFEDIMTIPIRSCGAIQ